jgi:hypothetical protein
VPLPGQKPPPYDPSRDFWWVRDGPNGTPQPRQLSGGDYYTPAPGGAGNALPSPTPDPRRGLNSAGGRGGTPAASTRVVSGPGGATLQLRTPGTPATYPTYQARGGNLSPLPSFGGGAPVSAPAWQAPSAVGADKVQAMIERLGLPTKIRAGPRVKVAGLDRFEPYNDFEALALARAAEGFDPGAGQFVGKELAEQIFTPEQVNQMAQQRAAPAIRALQDAERLATAAGSRAGYVDPARIAALRAQAAVETAGARGAATRDAQLEAAAANAEQAARSAANRRENFAQDLAARLGLGNLGLGQVQTLGGIGVQRRGQSMDYELGRGRLGVEQRGQDLAARRAQEELNADRAKAAAGLSTDVYRTRVGENLDLGRLGLTARGQDIELGLGNQRAGLDRDRMNADLWSGQQDRLNRLDMLDRQLGEERISSNQRAELERERMQLQREIEQAQLTQRGSEFAQSLGLDERRFGLAERQFGEGVRQFGLEQEYGREQGRLNRDFGRERAGVPGYGYGRGYGGSDMGSIGSDAERLAGGIGGGASLPTGSSYYDQQMLIDAILRQLELAGAAA